MAQGSISPETFERKSFKRFGSQWVHDSPETVFPGRGDKYLQLILRAQACWPRLPGGLQDRARPPPYFFFFFFPTLTSSA